MHIISHRGAMGYGDENSLKTIKIASELDVDYIEFDIQFTKNNIIVLQHNTVTPKGLLVKDYTYKTLQREISYMPTLRDALRECNDKPAMIESKAKGTIAKSLDIIKNSPNSVIVSKLPEEILSARINLPNNKTFFIKSPAPFGVIDTAKELDAQGVGINKNWLLLLPYYYYKARKSNLEILCYTVNSKILAKIISKFLPNILIVTNYPKELIGSKNG